MPAEDHEKLDRVIHRSSDQPPTVGDGEGAPHNLGYVVLGRRYDNFTDLQPWEREVLAIEEFERQRSAWRASRTSPAPRLEVAGRFGHAMARILRRSP